MYPVIIVILPNDVSSHLHIWDQLFITFFIRENCLGFSNAFHFDSLYRLRRSVVDNVKTDICIFKNIYHSK